MFTSRLNYNFNFYLNDFYIKKTFQFIFVVYRGFGPDPKNTKLEVKSFVPSLISVANYKSTMNLFALPITTEGVSNTTICM